MEVPTGYRVRPVMGLQSIDTGEFMKPADYVRVYLSDWRANHPKEWPGGWRVQSAVRATYGVEVSVRRVYQIIREMSRT